MPCKPMHSYHIEVSIELLDLHLLLNRWMNNQDRSNIYIFTVHANLRYTGSAEYFSFISNWFICFNLLSKSGSWCSAASGTHDDKTLTWMVEHCDVTVCMCEESSQQCGTMAFQCLQHYGPLFILVHYLLLFSPWESAFWSYRRYAASLLELLYLFSGEWAQPSLAGDCRGSRQNTSTSHAVPRQVARGTRRLFSTRFSLSFSCKDLATLGRPANCVRASLLGNRCPSRMLCWVWEQLKGEQSVTFVQLLSIFIELALY